MNITRQIAFGYMKAQKRRTFLTIFGVVMAVALVSAIGLFLSSIMGMLRTTAEYTDGSHHFRLDGLTEQQVNTLLASDYIETSGRMKKENYLFFAQEEGDGHFICILEERDPNAMELIRVELTEGRLPENGSECILTERAWQDMSPRPAVGDVITLPVGKVLEYGGAPEITGERTFTLVGLFTRGYSSVAMTGMEQAEDAALLVRVKGFGEKHMLLSRALADCGIDCGYESNNSYLRTTFEGGTAGMRLALSSTFLTLSVIILAAMILVIRNSFAMSLAEKITQFGILRCVGATPKQIRSVMYTEAMIIWGIGLPSGILLGILAMVIVFAIVNTIDLEMLKYLSLVVEWQPFLITAVLSFLAVILSARAPAKKAGKISPIEAVRGSILFRDDSKHKTRRTVRRPLFGFAGLMARRNIRRNRKRYRVTAMSIVVSMALFVGLTSFASSVSDAFGTMGRLEAADYRASASLQDIEPLKEFAAAFEDEDEILKHKALFYQTSLELLSIDKVEGELTGVNVICIDEEGYSQLELEKGAPTYEELVASGGAVLCQTAIEGDADTGLEYVKLADFAVGDTLLAEDPIFEAAWDVENERYSEQTLAKATVSLRVDAILPYPAWFTEYSGIFCYIPLETAQNIAYSEEFRQVYAEKRYAGDPPANLLERGYAELYLKAKDGKQEDLSKRAVQIVRELELEDEINRYDIYADIKEVRNTVVVVNIFVYGFMAVVVLICLVNICNTISTNIHARARELAMLRATGMSRRQFRRMLFLECLLYSFGGAVIGGIIGTLIYLLLGYTMGFAFDLRPANLPLYLLIGFAGTILVAYLSGLLPLHGKLRKPIVEDIRAAE
ncbi:MAG: ABC transporter permease [Clostridia bacterium]|nr:ABC transporter permease [Clostridia bacterium]